MWLACDTLASSEGLAGGSSQYYRILETSGPRRCNGSALSDLQARGDSMLPAASSSRSFLYNRIILITWVQKNKRLNSLIWRMRIRG